MTKGRQRLRRSTVYIVGKPASQDQTVWGKVWGRACLGCPRNSTTPREARAQGARGIIPTAFWAAEYMVYIHGFSVFACCSLTALLLFILTPQMNCELYKQSLWLLPSLYVPSTFKWLFTESACLAFVDSINHKEDKQIPWGQLWTSVTISPPILVVSSNLHLC